MLSRLKIQAVLLVLLTHPTFALGPVEDEKYELIGKLVDFNGEPFRGVVPAAHIRSASDVFSKTVLVGPGGGFKIKGLKTGTYSLSLSVPGYGEVRKSVEVGPSSADRKGRVEIVVELAGDNRIPPRSTVSAAQLSVPYKAFQRYEKAQNRLGKSDAKGAIKELHQAIRISPEFAAAWNLLGTIQYQTNEPVEAEKSFREALKHDPAYYPPLVNLGAAVLVLGRADEAIEINREAVGERPDDPLAHSQLGQAYLMSQDLANAEIHLKRAKSLDPSHFSFPQLFLAEIYRLRGDQEAELKELEEFARDHPDTAATPAVLELISQVKSGQ